ncbi:MAG: mechanosensitive ion channel [Acidobacteria bacterium]|nr:MAG: mechanosensitive ion channel [Acidobacteriota bacterium]
MNETELGFLEFLKLDNLPIAVVAIVIGVVLIRVTVRFFDGMGERFTRRRLVLKQVAAVLKFFIVMLTAFFVATTLVNFSNQALLALGGSAALAFGFAFKDILASLIAGLILLFDRPFQVGDRIAFAGYYGEVKEIGLRSVRLVTLDDNLVSIPNNKFLTDVVASANAGELHQMVVLHFYIRCDADFASAKTIAQEAAVSSPYVYLEEPVQVSLQEGPVPGMATHFALEVTVKAYVFDGRFETAFGTDVTERVKRAFKAAGIHTVGEMDRPAMRSGEL